MLFHASEGRLTEQDFTGSCVCNEDRVSIKLFKTWKLQNSVDILQCRTMLSVQLQKSFHKFYTVVIMTT